MQLIPTKFKPPPRGMQHSVNPIMVLAGILTPVRERVFLLLLAGVAEPMRLRNEKMTQPSGFALVP